MQKVNLFSQNWSKECSRRCFHLLLLSDLTSSSSSSSIGLESVRLRVLFLSFFVAPYQPTFPYSFSSLFIPRGQRPWVTQPEKRGKDGNSTILLPKVVARTEEGDLTVTFPPSFFPFSILGFFTTSIESESISSDCPQKNARKWKSIFSDFVFRICRSCARRRKIQNVTMETNNCFSISHIVCYF